jgi:hypothetical protein
MKCQKCPSANHNMKRVLSNTLIKTAMNCNNCGFPINSLKNFYACGTCSGYFLCQNCKVCDAGHLLFQCYNLAVHGKPGEGIYYKNQYMCDKCKTPYTNNDPSNPVYHCIPCKFDICNDCLQCEKRFN